ncbi:MAG: 4a-hydroxytetrahydrobiopterin dehydratase [Vicinamibacterales bacterium]
MTLLTSDQIDERLRTLPGWTLCDRAIARRFSFASFRDAIAFIVRLGFDAEAADHHPDLTVSGRRVVVSYSTHSAGGLTPRDFDCAAGAERVAASMTASVLE